MGVSGPGAGASYDWSSPNTTSSSNLNYGGTQMTVTNPGNVDISAANPAASRYTGNIDSMIDQYKSSSLGAALDPSQYKMLQDTQQQNLTTSLGNQYARMGLAGSSAEMGGMSQAITNNSMSWLSRQQSDQMRAMQGYEGLNQMGYNQTMGIQNQYGDYESSLNQDIASLLGLNQQSESSNQQFISSILGSIFGAGGSAAGGMSGAGSGGGLAGLA